jgi:hypothetical protein
MIGKKNSFLKIKKTKTKSGFISRIPDNYEATVEIANPISEGYPIIIVIEMPEGESVRMFLTTDVEKVKLLGENKFLVETSTSFYEVATEE